MDSYSVLHRSVTGVWSEVDCSGTPRDFRLHALQMEVDDPSLFELEAAVRAVGENNGMQTLENGQS